MKKKTRGRPCKISPETLRISDIADACHKAGVKVDFEFIPEEEFLTRPEKIAVAPKSVPELLRAAAETYEERNKIYGDNYKHFGMVMNGLFPDGLNIAMDDVDAFNRLGVFIQCASKLTRYAQNLAQGGHVDSAHDLTVYASMLEELTKKGA